MDFKRRLSFFVISSGVSQVLTLFAMIAISHLVSPSEVGVFYFILSVTTLLLPFCVLRMDNELTVSDTVLNIKNSFVESIVVAFSICLSTCLLGILTIFLRESFTLKNLFIICAIWVLTNIQILSTLLIAVGLRNREVTLISSSSLFQNFTSSSLQITLAFVFPYSASIFIGYLFGRVIGLKKLILAAGLDLKAFYKTKIYFANSFSARSYMILPGAIDALILTVPLVIIMNSGSFEAMGIFGFAQSLILAPIAVISGALYSTLVTRNQDKVSGPVTGVETQSRNSIALVIRLIPVVIVIFCIEYIGGLVIFRSLIDNEWRIAEQIFFQLLAPIMLQILIIPTNIYHWKYNLWSQYSLIVFFALIVSLIFVSFALFLFDLPLVSCVGLFHLVKNIFLIPALICGVRFHAKRSEES